MKNEILVGDQSGSRNNADGGCRNGAQVLAVAIANGLLACCNGKPVDWSPQVSGERTVYQEIEPIEILHELGIPKCKVTRVQLMDNEWLCGGLGTFLTLDIRLSRIAANLSFAWAYRKGLQWP